MPDFNDLREEVSQFLEVYKILPPEAKAALEGQIINATENSDNNTKKLYKVLLKAAQDRLTSEEAVEAMKKVYPPNLAQQNKPGQLGLERLQYPL